MWDRTGNTSCGPIEGPAKAVVVVDGASLSGDMFLQVWSVARRPGDTGDGRSRSDSRAGGSCAHTHGC